MTLYRKYNNLFGWTAFGIALITYVLTAEPTASLWDCGEFITSGFKLEVGHSPGAPLFMLMSRVASLFAGSNVALAARMINYLSALASAFTILFLFWTITRIAKKLVQSNSEITKPQLWIILGSGLVGAMAFTFSDSFWFSAVEGEVYATSSLFTAVVFWAILKWEDVADEKFSNRWLILIFFLTGLSIGVHLLNLLAIPAIVLVFYFRKFKVTPIGIIVAIAVSIAILGITMYGIIQGIVVVASWFELFFVNTLKLPFNSGILFYTLLLMALLVYGIYISFSKKKVILNTIILGIVMLLLGYTSYAALVIRANAEPPVNENKPDNVFTFLSYLNRDQYGQTPLIHGQYFNAPVLDYEEEKPSYAAVNNQYIVTNKNYKAIYDPRFTTFFPRMYSTDPNHIEVYRDWADITGKPEVVTENNHTKTLYVPTFGENLKFFFKYQVGQMYMRYFMWNFVGRQNDEQGSGGILKGNWISGINFIDSIRLGPQNNLPESLKKIPSRNKYYFLPFILGIIGLVYLLDKDKKYFIITIMLFFMTGLAIVLYLNQTPLQPRERDYAYVGSFYVFAIWIGLGVISVYNFISSKKENFAKAIITVLLCAIMVPGIMAKENWNDHDRSSRYTTRSYAYNYLNSCARNAILFTFGDNDTFPLWYLQEVEGIRTDVRVVNTMLLNADWYIDAMKEKAYDSDTLPISLNHKQYISGKRDAIYIFDNYKDPISLKQAIEFVASDNPDTKTIKGYDQQFDYIPGRNFIIPVDTAEVFKNGTVDRKDSKLVEKALAYKLKGNHIDKSQLITLDIIAHNNWKRPIYFDACNMEGTCNLDTFLQLDGFVYRLVPIKTKYTSMANCGHINTELMYDIIMNKSYYGNVENPKVYLDNFHSRTYLIMRYRNKFAHLANALITENKNDSAIAVLDKCQQVVPSSKIANDEYTIELIEAYFAAKAFEKGSKLLDEYYKTCSSELDYYMSLRKGLRRLIDYDIRNNFEIIGQMEDIAKKHNLPVANEIKQKISSYEMAYSTN